MYSYLFFDQQISHIIFKGEKNTTIDII